MLHLSTTSIRNKASCVTGGRLHPRREVSYLLYGHSQAGRTCKLTAVIHAAAYNGHNCSSGAGADADKDREQKATNELHQDNTHDIHASKHPNTIPEDTVNKFLLPSTGGCLQPVDVENWKWMMIQAIKAEADAAEQVKFGRIRTDPADVSSNRSTSHSKSQSHEHAPSITPSVGWGTVYDPLSTRLPYGVGFSAANLDLANLAGQSLMKEAQQLAAKVKRAYQLAVEALLSLSSLELVEHSRAGLSAYSDVLGDVHEGYMHLPVMTLDEAKKLLERTWDLGPLE